MAGVETLKKRKSEEEKAPTESKISVKVKFEVYGEEIIDKKVMRSGDSGRVYVPPGWENRYVKVIRID